MLANLNQTKSPRDLLTPQMIVYDKLSKNWFPYLMFFNEPNFTSNVVNTDEMGFRLTKFDNKDYSVLKNYQKDNRYSLIVGGSTAFGIGSSSDMQTIPSLLSKKTNEIFLNIAGRGYGSNQELIIFSQIAHRYKNINEVILFTGLNELYLSLFHSYNPHFGSSFYVSDFTNIMDTYYLSFKRRMLKAMLYPFYGENINYKTISFFELFKRLPYLEKFPYTKSKKAKSINIDYTVNQIKKNLFIWKKFSKSFPFKIKFILQPFAEWCSKELSDQEMAIFSHLDKNYDSFHTMSLINNAVYQEYSKLIKLVCDDLEIEYHDLNLFLSNKFYNKKWIFVDRAHLNDYGNEVIADKLLNIIEG